METLPREIIFEIMFKLGPPEVASLAKTNSTLSEMCLSEKVWERFCKNKEIKVLPWLTHLKVYKEYVSIPLFLVGKTEETFKFSPFGYLKRNLCPSKIMGNRVFAKSFMIFTDRNFVFCCAAFYDKRDRCFSRIEKSSYNNSLLAFWFPQDYFNNKPMVEGILRKFRLSDEKKWNIPSLTDDTKVI